MGLTSVLVFVGASVVLIGPKELPLVAHQLGRAVGRTVSALRGLRQVVRKAAQDPEIQRLSSDVEKGLAVSKHAVRACIFMLTGRWRFVQDVRRIRTDIAALSAREAPLYPSAPVASPAPPAASAAVAAPVASSSPRPAPPVQPRIYSPTHTDTLEGGADLVGEVIQLSERGRRKTLD